MCENCFEEEYHGFNSSLDYASFYDDLLNKVNSEKMSLVKKEFQLVNLKVDNYRCNYCHTLWTLSKYEKNWVGFFVKYDHAHEYVMESGGKALMRLLGVILIGIILVALAIYLILQFKYLF